jgi:hypothetical protein
MSKSCFVIMPIGAQTFDGEKVPADDLKNKYDDLIKEAILKADPTLEVVRADEVSIPGTITSDILTRIMHSDYVVADITYPNPNVFYELGLRHACRIGTIIIKDKNAPKIPFDIAHLRCIEYENTPTGLKNLAQDIRTYLDHFAHNPDRPDNQLLELAKLTRYSFPRYGQEEDIEAAQTQAFVSMLQSPQILQLVMRKASGEEVSDLEIAQAIMTNPDSASMLIKAMVRSGELSFQSSKPQQKRKASKGKKHKRK